MPRDSSIVIPAPWGITVCSLLRVWHRIVHALCSRQAQYITVARTDALDAFALSGEGDKADDIECVIVESSAALEDVTCTIPPAIPRATLRHRLQRGCIVVLACKPPQVGPGMDCVGYSILERGVFSALGRRKQVSSDILFAHHAEVLPAYRGRRIYYAMMLAQLAYGQQHGVRKVCAVVSTHNRASLSGTSRIATITGVVARVVFFRGLFVLETPWKRIARALGEEEQGRDGSEAAS